MKHSDLQDTGQPDLAQDMQGASDVPDAPVKAPPKKRRARRGGHITKAETEIINKFTLDQPREPDVTQIRALAKLLNRSPDAVKKVVDEARLEFAGNAKDYVKLHMDSTKGAFERFDFETAGKLSQWAIERMGLEGSRVIEQPTAQGNMPQVVIGVHLGGSGMQKPEALPAITVEPIDHRDS